MSRNSLNVNEAGQLVTDSLSAGGPGLPAGTSQYYIPGKNDLCDYIRKDKQGNFYYLSGLDANAVWLKDTPPPGVIIAIFEAACKVGSNPMLVMLAIAAVSVMYSLDIGHKVHGNPEALLGDAQNLLANRTTFPNGTQTALVQQDLARLGLYINGSQNCQMAQSIILMSALWLHGVRSATKSISANWAALTTGGCKQSMLSLATGLSFAGGLANMPAALYTAIRQYNATDWFMLKKMGIEDPMFRVVTLITLAAMSLYTAAFLARKVGEMGDETAVNRVNQSWADSAREWRDKMVAQASLQYSQASIWFNPDPMRRCEVFKEAHQAQQLDNRASTGYKAV